MMLRRIILSLIFAGVSSTAFAVSGTPEEQDACRPDVRKFCSKMPPNSDDTAFLNCLENNRDKLSIKCLNVLMDHGR